MSFEPADLADEPEVEENEVDEIEDAPRRRGRKPGSSYLISLGMRPLPAVMAVSLPGKAGWAARCVGVEGATTYESRQRFASIAEAVAHGQQVLKQQRAFG